MEASLYSLEKTLSAKSVWDFLSNLVRYLSYSLPSKITIFKHNFRTFHIGITFKILGVACQLWPIIQEGFRWSKSNQEWVGFFSPYAKTCIQNELHKCRAILSESLPTDWNLNDIIVVKRVRLRTQNVAFALNGWSLSSVVMFHISVSPDQ